jgi:FAD/FMN-containing dehydrogenase
VDDLPSLGRPAGRFVRHVAEIAPGQARPIDEPWWDDALVLVEAGEVELECRGGGRATFVRGDVLFVVGLEARSLRNRGTSPAVVAAVGRAGPSDDSRRLDRSVPMRTRNEERETMTVNELHAALDGALIEPGDEGYDAARAVFYGGFDKRPRAIARVANAQDVARVIAFARESGLELAVRSGGHSVAGHGVSEGGLVLDLSGMKGLEIDPASRTAWAETGLTAAELVTSTAEHGLALGFGDTGSVGIGGITLGGGVGYLVRKHGLTIDALVAAEVVTADGDVLHVDERSHPDLFWAIRGGGGNVGVATRFRYRLHDLPRVVGGMLMLPATAGTISRFIELADAAPEELTTIVNVMPAPPMPFVPAEHHGRLAILALVCYAGTGTEAERTLAPFRALAEPIADMVREIDYPELYPPEDPDSHPLAWAETLFVDEIDHASVDTIVERIAAEAPAFRVVQIRPLGGAVARVPNDATAYAHRDRPYMLNVAALFESPDPGERERGVAWVHETAARIQRGPVAAYVNFLEDEGPERVRAAYPGATWDRLVEVKRRYDPTNLFHVNQNVPPTSEEASR